MPHSLLEKKISVSFWANLASYGNPLKLAVFLIFEYVLHAEPDRCFACTLLNSSVGDESDLTTGTCKLQLI